VARRPGNLLLAALWCAVAFLALLAVAYGSEDARSLDARALHGFIDLQRPAVERTVNEIAALGSPPQVALLTALLAGVALIRGRPRLVIAVLGLLAATSVSSQLLKALLAYPRFQGTIGGAYVDPAAFPSGHATASMSIALAGVLVAPPRARPLAAILGLTFALAVSLSVVTLGWHFPSDVIGGFLLAAFWTLIVAAGLTAADRRWPERSGRTRATAALQGAADWVTTLGMAALALAVVLAVAIGAGTLLVTRLPDLLDYADGHTAVVAIGAAIVVAAAAVLAGMTAALRRS
jgi:membrane-associated phospholipid phosphatase